MRISDKTPEDIAREEAEAVKEQQKEEGRQRILAETLAGMTNLEIDDWVEANITNDNLVGVKTGFKILAKLVRALIRYHKVRQDD